MSERTFHYIILAVVTVMMIIAVFLLDHAAHAKYKPEYGANSPEIQAWFKGQHNEEGQWCCDEADGHRFDGSYWFNQDGSVTVSENGKEYKIEKYKVLNGHNPTGGAVWWYIDAGGGRHTYCFSPGSLT